MTEQSAIMSDVTIGNRNVGAPCLWFRVEIREGVGALQVLNWAEAEMLIKNSKLYDFRDLEGKPCWVEVGDGKITFLRLANLSAKRKATR